MNTLKAHYLAQKLSLSILEEINGEIGKIIKSTTKPFYKVSDSMEKKALEVFAKNVNAFNVKNTELNFLFNSTNLILSPSPARNENSINICVFFYFDIMNKGDYVGHFSSPRKKSCIMAYEKNNRLHHFPFEKQEVKSFEEIEQDYIDLVELNKQVKELKKNMPNFALSALEYE